MADPKANLLRRDQYGFRMAAELASELIAAAEYGRPEPAPVALVIEALDADDWDDIVVHYHADSGPIGVTHWQVKRQSTALGVEAGEKLLKGARDLLAQGGEVPRDFRFGVQTAVAVAVAGGNEVELRALGTLCDKARASGPKAVAVQTADKLEERAYAYVSSVTGLQGADLTSFLCNLRIEFLGNEERIAKAAVARLEPFFVNAAEVYDSLRAYLGDHFDGRTQFTYQKLHDDVLAKVGKREPTRPMWLHLRPSRSLQSWEQRGPLSSSPVVRPFWDTNAPSQLRIDASPLASADVARALARLILHRSAATGVRTSHHDEWNLELHRRTSGSVGVRATSTPVDAFDGGCCPVPPVEVATAEFARRMTAEMDALAWSGIADGVRLALANNGAPAFEIHPALAQRSSDLFVSPELCDSESRGR
jgi:hypothetical protein